MQSDLQMHVNRTSVFETGTLSCTRFPILLNIVSTSFSASSTSLVSLSISLSSSSRACSVLVASCPFCEISSKFISFYVLVFSVLARHSTYDDFHCKYLARASLHPIKIYTMCTLGPFFVSSNHSVNVFNWFKSSAL